MKTIRFATGSEAISQSSEARYPQPASEYLPSKCADVFDLDMGDGLILYDRDSYLVHHLNPSAAVVWYLCDGASTVGDLTRLIATGYRLDPERVRPQVAGIVRELEGLGLIVDAHDRVSAGNGTPLAGSSA
jgi:hypothetical protein